MKNDYEDTEQWGSRKLGASETFVQKSQVADSSIDEALGLKPISIRLPQGMIDDLKAIAALHGIGYQPLIKKVLNCFIENEHKNKRRNHADIQK